MPFRPRSIPDDYPERLSPRPPWDKWGPEEQTRRLREAIGEGAWGMLSQSRGHACRSFLRLELLRRN
jgi:hypothetical protein